MLVVQLASFVLIAGTSFGVVREHCADLETSSRETGVDIDSGWTYIVWPPFTFANIDPSGGCVRNAPAREVLDAVGIWELPPPEVQVREHVLQQLRDER